MPTYWLQQRSLESTLICVEPNHGVEAGSLRILLSRVGLAPWSQLMSKQYPELPISLNPWELTVLRIGSSAVVARRRFPTKRAANAARERFAAEVSEISLS